MLCFLQNEKYEGILLVILLFSAITNGELLPSTSLTLHEVHLVRCLKNISHRYFTPGRSLVISSPAIYRHVQKELIAEIHRTAIWPVVVTVDGNISKANETGFIDRDGNYIILVPDGDFQSFQDEFLGLVVGQGKFTTFWNSEARFVVAGANEFSMWQQEDIFDYLSIYRIYNCIIVNQEHYVIDKKYSRPIDINDVDTVMKLGVYTWFPYQSSDRCTEVNDITLLDSWVISAQGHFTKNTDLFPGKISNNLNRCPMKAVVSVGHSDFTTRYFERTYSNGSVERNIEGLEIKLLMIVLQQMNMTLVLVPSPEPGEIEDEALLNYLLECLYIKKCYITVGYIGIDSSVNSLFESTNPYYFFRIRWYVPCPVKYPRWSSIFRILTVELWLVLIISIVIAAISTTLVGRYSCTSEWQVYKTLTNSLTNVWAVILGVSVSTMPRTPSLRSLFLAWVCFSLAFSTVFQAFLTTFLIDSGYKTPIKNMDELFSSGIKLASPPDLDVTVETVYERETSNISGPHVKCPSYKICRD